MIVNMAGSATEEQINHVVERIKEFGYQAHLIRGEERTVIGIVGASGRHRSELEALRSSPGVQELVAISHPFKLASRDVRPEGTVLDLGKGVTVGGKDVLVAAGPCAVESAAQIEAIAASVAKAGAKCCAEARSSRAARRTAFKGLARKA
jgi:3-deoxy-7-phosphoheptulonate synthase